jgi:hypothetical protein
VHRAVLAGVVVAAACLAAGCGSSDTLSLDPIANAANTSMAQSGEHFTMTGNVTVNGQTIKTTGVGDFANKPVKGTMTLVALIPGKSGAVPMQEVADGTKIYMTSSEFKNQLPSGKKWLAIDYGKTARAMGISLPATQQSPVDMLKQLKKSSHITKVGTAVVDGVQTTQYAAQADSSVVHQLESALKTTVSYEPTQIWIDGHGLVRKLAIHYSVGETSATPAMHYDITEYLSKYGEAVSVKVPSASETYDETNDAIKQLKTGGTS